MTRRAERVDETRQRITEAAVRLHTTVGPSKASFARIAEEAGVTRVTLYRHFADPDELFMACTAHWTAQDPPPDPGSWVAVPKLPARVRLAVGELYSWYAARGEDLYPIFRDVEAVPDKALVRRRVNDRRRAAALVGADGPSGERGERLRAAALHVVNFWTWRSLTVEAGLTKDQAVDLAVSFVLAAAR